MKKICVLLFLFILTASGYAQPQKFRSGLFLHRDVGMNIWGPNGSGTSVPNEINNYNSSNGFSVLNMCSLNERFWPSDIVTNEWSAWKDIFYNVAIGADITGILDSNNIVIIKSDFHSSSITGWGTPSDTLTPLIKSVYNYKWLWRKIIYQMKLHYLNYFEIWTNPPEAIGATNLTEASLAHSFCKWAKDTLAKGLDPAFGKFPLNVYVFDFFHKLADASTSWTLNSIYTNSNIDSRPNSAATALVAPLFVQETFNNSTLYEKYFNPNALTLPVMILPINGAPDQGVNETLSWHNVSAATKYLLQVALDTGFTNISFDRTNLTDTTYNITGLVYNTIYYWKVKAQNYVGTTDWTQSRSFTTIIAAPGVPTQIAPQDSAIEQDINIFLSWNITSPPAATYRIQISKSANFSPLILDSTNITVTAITVLNRLDSSTTYYWRVKSLNRGGESNWSNTRIFTTKLAMPGNITLANPPDGQTDVPINIILKWYKGARASSYQLQFASDMNFSNIMTDSSGIKDTSFTVSRLANNTQFFWRVRARNVRGVTPWSSVSSFTTIIAIPDIPELIEPVQGKTDVPLLPVFNWYASARAERYHFQLSPDADYAITIIDNEILTDTTITSLQTLTRNTIYYWRVNCANTAGETSWSESRSFTTINYPPSAPLLTSPADSATDVPTSATFTWEASATASNYRIQIAEDYVFHLIQTDNASLTSTTFVVGTELKPTTKYFWHLVAINAGGGSNWSETRSFTTGIAVGINENDFVQSTFEIVPNPFNESTQIKFSIAERNLVSVTIFDLLGRKISNLLDDELSPGEYSLNFDNSPSLINNNSMLLCRLQIGNRVYVKKMIYLP